MDQKMMSYLDEFENRSSPRYKCNFQANVSLADACRCWGMEIIDVSESGLRIRSDYRDLPILPGTTINLSLENPSNLGSMNFSGKIVYFGIGSDGRDLLGIKIIHIDEDTQCRWGQLVSSLSS